MQREVGRLDVFKQAASPGISRGELMSSSRSEFFFSPQSLWTFPWEYVISISDFSLVPKETCLQETLKTKQDLSPIRIKVVGVVMMEAGAATQGWLVCLSV